MARSWSHCAFYRAKNTSSRVIALLRRDDSSIRQPVATNDLALLQELLYALGPETEQVVRELTARAELTPHELDELDARLRAQLEAAEEKQPDTLNDLEQFIFRPVCFQQVLTEELEEIAKTRSARGTGAPRTESVFDRNSLKERARRAEICGLALSGGGIRSATFNLGLLQGLAKYGVLRTVDYLSMVSGGGYIGGWLTAWIKREGFDAVEKSLADEQTNPRSARMQPISFLRDYSSYLTPQTGLFSADTWTAFMTWTRNTLLNLIVLLSGLSAVLLVPRLLKSSQLGLQGWLFRAFQSHIPEETLMIGAIICEFLIIFHAGRNLGAFKFAEKDDKRANSVPGFGYPPRQIQRWIIIPALVAAWLGSARLWGLAIELSGDVDEQDLFIHMLGLGCMVTACFVLLTYLQWRGGFKECYLRERRRSTGQIRMAWFLCFLLPLITAIIKASLLYGVYLLFVSCYHAFPSHRDALAVTFGTPLFLTVFALCISVHMGLMGRNFPDDRREWWSRIAAYLGIYAAGLSAVFAVAFFGSTIVRNLFNMRTAWLAAVAFWLLTTIGGLLAARKSKSEKTADGDKRNRSLVLEAFSVFSPAVFVAGLFIGLSAALDTLLNGTQDYLEKVPAVCAGLSTFCTDLGRLEGQSNATFANPLVVLGFLCFFLIVMFGFASTVDINEFSMHHFYRNRLIRAYLGASHCGGRRPNRLTGFDQGDDMLLASLRPECEPGLRECQDPYTGPYPIFNSALNLVHGDRLSWQERKATSFVFTPKFCGYDFSSNTDIRIAPPLRDSGFRPTSVYAYSDGGIHLGTAMAISGAAVSPNAGVHTSTAMAFLLTVFNVRLGWWIGNPRHDRSWQRSGPRFGLMYLLYELFGWTNDRRGHVYLSDGGHFDNLGIYELVRRRCSLIIASDAEEDAGCKFLGLGGVIRKCFIDFGVRIDIDLDEVRPSDGLFSNQHFAIGRIYYPEGWSGTLLYIKSSLTGDEPADLREYMARQQAFPNQSTVDQFFDESQFESYHRLGLHIAKSAFGPLGAGRPLVPDQDKTRGKISREIETLALRKIRNREWTQPHEAQTCFFWTDDQSHAAAGD